MARKTRTAYRDRAPNGRTSSAYSWEAVTRFGSASNGTWPLDRVASVQDTIARLASLSGLCDLFPGGEGLLLKDGLLNHDISAPAVALAALGGNYRVAAERIQHDPNASATMAYTLNGLMLAILAHSETVETALDLWKSIGLHIASALRSIEQRQTLQYAHSLNSLRAQAMQVSVSTSLGAFTTTSPGLGSISNPLNPGGLLNPAPRIPNDGGALKPQPNAFTPNNNGGNLGTQPNPVPYPPLQRTSAAEGATQGFQQGSAFGPYGSAIGAGIGAATSDQGQQAIGSAANALINLG